MMFGLFGGNVSTINQYFGLLGRRMEDKVTGFHGVVSSISFDLYGCIQAVLTPPVHTNEKGAMTHSDSMWFDVNRLVAVDDGPERVMPAPNYDGLPTPERYSHGPADKPLP